MRMMIVGGMLAASAATATAAAQQPTHLEREVTVPGPVPLPGTLTVPAGNGPFPGVIIVHGSGAGDRDLTVGFNRPYRDIAQGLAERGIAVLRYDKRSRVQPMWFLGRVFTVRDEAIDDAVAALALLRSQPEVDGTRVALIGHSLGGMISARIAAADGGLAGVVIMAGATTVPLADQIERQFAYLRSIPGADTTQIDIQMRQLGPMLARVREISAADSGDTTLLLGAPPAYYLDLAANDPAAGWRDRREPLLVLQGERDYQVTVEQLDDWLARVGQREGMTVKRYPALNHLFLAGTGVPGPADYAEPRKVDSRVLDDIAAWIRSLR